MSQRVLPVTMVHPRTHWVQLAKDLQPILPQSPKVLVRLVLTIVMNPQQDSGLLPKDSLADAAIPVDLKTLGLWYRLIFDPKAAAITLHRTIVPNYYIRIICTCHIAGGR